MPNTMNIKIKRYEAMENKIKTLEAEKKLLMHLTKFFYLADSSHPEYRRNWDRVTGIKYQEGESNA